MYISSISSGLSDLSTSAVSRMAKMQAQQLDASQFAAKIVEESDTNGDGVLSADETRFDSKQFKAIDSDGDGLLTAEELQADIEARQVEMESRMGGLSGMPPGPPPDAAEMASHIIAQDDTDGDGLLSVKEARVDSEHFAAIDADGDGLLTAVELQADIEARQAEMESEKGGSGQTTADGGNALQSLLDILSQNEASEAYSEQSWVNEMLQSAVQNFGVTA